MIEEILTQAYGKDVAEEVVTGKKKIEEVMKDWDSIAGKFTGLQLAQAKNLYDSIYGQDKWFPMTKRVLDAATGEMRLEEYYCDVKTYVAGEMAEIKRQQLDVDTYLKDFLSSGKIKITKGGKQITADDIDKIMKNVNGFIEGVNNGKDFYKLLNSRVNLDKKKVNEFCDMLDSCTDLTPEIYAAKYLLRAETSDNVAEQLGAIIAEYAINLAVKEVGKAAVKGVEEATGADANPYYAAMKATAALCNLEGNVKEVVSNTRGMTAQYENYASMYSNYIRLRKKSDDHPTDDKLRKDAKNALILALLFNIEADEYYLKMTEGIGKSLAMRTAEVITGNTYSGSSKLSELKRDINTEITNRNANLELLKYGKITTQMSLPERVEFTAYAWEGIRDYDWSTAGDTLWSDKVFYVRNENSTKFAVDGLYESVQSTFRGETIDGNTLDFVELKSSTGRTFIITKAVYDQVKAKHQ